MKVGITGGSGVIGTYVCDKFTRAGHDVTSIDIRPPSADVAFIEVDLCKLDDTWKALDGFDTIVHLAAIPNPFDDPAERVMAVNMASTFNVFEAVRRTGIGRVVYGCSESSSGFGIHEVKLTPEYLPVDEAHPLWPHETYSLSKHFGERIGDNYAKAFGIKVVSLRYAWVWDKRGEESIKRISTRARAGEFDPQDAWFGAYVVVHDVATACLAGAQYQFPADQVVPFEAFFITAKNTSYPVPTLEVLGCLYDPMPPIKDQAYFDAEPHASVFDIRKAERLLGWRPQYGWENLEQWQM